MRSRTYSLVDPYPLSTRSSTNVFNSSGNAPPNLIDITARAAARAATADLVRSTAAALRSDERHRDAADLLRRIVAIDRYDDLAHELLVSCLLDTGDVAAARDAHDARVRAMAELDIDVAPFNGG